MDLPHYRPSGERPSQCHEDQQVHPAGFYRFVPNNKNDLRAGGVLQMLAVAGRPGYDTRKGQTVGVDLRTTWVTIPTPDPGPASGGPAARVVRQGSGLGGGVFDYLEGADFKNGSVTFTSAYGGDNNHGQVWRFTPSTGLRHFGPQPSCR